MLLNHLDKVWLLLRFLILFFLASDKIWLVVETAGCLLSRRQISNGSNCGQVPLEKIKGPSCLLGSCWKRLKWQTWPSKAASSHQKTHGRPSRVHVQIGYKLESIIATTAGVDFSTTWPTTENLSARGAIPSRRQFKLCNYLHIQVWKNYLFVN